MKIKVPISPSVHESYQNDALYLIKFSGIFEFYIQKLHHALEISIEW